MTNSFYSSECDKPNKTANPYAQSKSPEGKLPSGLHSIILSAQIYPNRGGFRSSGIGAVYF